MKKYLFVAVLFILITSLSMFVIIFNALNIVISIDKRFAETDDGFVYIQMQHESNPMKVDIQNFDKIYQSLAGSYTYYEIYQQPLDMHPVNDESNRTPCIQISENVQTDYHLVADSGRLLMSDDFLFDESKPIPICIGYNFSQLFNVGDIFTADYLFAAYQFEVVGILSQGSVIVNSLYTISLDEYIIMPSFNVPDDIIQTDSLKIHYANKTSGLVKVLPDNSQSVKSDIEQLMAVSNAGDYEINVCSASINYKEITGLSLTATRYIAIISSLALLIISLLVTNKYIKEFKIRRKPSIKQFLQYLAFLILVVVISQSIPTIVALRFFSMRLPFVKDTIISTIICVGLFVFAEIKIMMNRKKYA